MRKWQTDDVRRVNDRAVRIATGGLAGRGDGVWASSARSDHGDSAQLEDGRVARCRVRSDRCDNLSVARWRTGTSAIEDAEASSARTLNSAVTL